MFSDREAILTQLRSGGIDPPISACDTENDGVLFADQRIKFPQLFAYEFVVFGNFRFRNVILHIKQITGGGPFLDIFRDQAPADERDKGNSRNRDGPTHRGEIEHGERLSGRLLSDRGDNDIRRCPDECHQTAEN